MRMNQHLLMIEDDARLAGMVGEYLSQSGYVVTHAGDGQSGLALLQSQSPSLVILDLMLPDIDGLEVCRRIRALPSGLAQTPVLMLTAKGDAMDRIIGLEIGADDYLPKPFEPRELVARVRSILRRRQAGTSSMHGQRRYASFVGWTLDCAANILHSPDGSEHILGTAEAMVLRAFLQRPHQILTREQLIGQRDLSPLDRSIDVRISRIRRKLEVDPQNPKIIKTVYGAGYMLMATVAWS